MGRTSKVATRQFVSFVRQTRSRRLHVQRAGEYSIYLNSVLQQCDGVARICMRWLSIVHPSLLRMSSPMELDAPMEPPVDTSEDDPGGRRDSTPSRSQTTLCLRENSLIGRLPREIIGEIFSEACNVDETATPSYGKTTLAPLHLSHVSKLWRQVAVATSRIWTHLQVVVRRADINPVLELVKLWVPRCKHRPLKVDVFFKGERGPFILYPEDSLNLFRVLTKTAALLRKGLKHDLDKAYFETQVRAGSSGTLPFIEEKYLWYYGINNPLSKEVLPGVPLLVRGVRRAVDEFGFGYHEPLSASLTKLELRDTNGVTCLSTTELLIILAEFRQLRYVAAFLDHGDTPPDDQVTAANLLTLKLSWAYTTDPGELFDHLSAPFLVEMELSGDVPSGAIWLHLYDFFDRNRPAINTLALEHFDTTAGVSRLAECLSLCSSLESLWLENCIVDDEFIASLSRRNLLAENSVLSRLRIFGLVSADDISGDCLVQTLRNVDMPKLQEVFVFDCNGVLQEHCEAIEELFKETASVGTIIVMPGEPLD